MDKYIREIYAYIHFTSVRACVILLLASTRVLVVLVDNSNKSGTWKEEAGGKSHQDTVRYCWHIRDIHIIATLVRSLVAMHTTTLASRSSSILARILL